GVRPTINDSKFAVEVNIFDFDNEIYGESLTVSFVERVRNELRFDSLQQLSDQLKRDKVNIRNLLVSNNDK
ncbi:MAG TPA: riboflavin kinase, partial [Bacteroidales bacterium]|nr:riboflavin kinase [Bacteroidales bacterium]